MHLFLVVLLLTCFYALCNCALPPVSRYTRNAPSPLPVSVDVAFEIRDIRVIQDVRSEFLANVLVHYMWDDPAMNTARENNQIITSVTQLPWNPPIRVTNHIKNDIFEEEFHLEPVGNSTRVHWKAQFFQSIFSFDFDSQEFPFDSQEIFWNIADFGVLISETNGLPVTVLKMYDDKAEGVLLRNNDKFQLQGFTVDNARLTINNAVDDGKVVFSQMRITLDAHRRWGPFLVRQILPGVIMTWVSWTGTFFKPNQLLPRVLPTLFGLLSQINLLSSANRFLPPANSITWFESFALVNVFLSFLPLIELTVVSKLEDSMAIKVDRMCRLLFPALMIASYTCILLLHLYSVVAAVIVFLLALTVILGSSAFWSYRTLRYKQAGANGASTHELANIAE